MAKVNVYGERKDGRLILTLVGYWDSLVAPDVEDAIDALRKDMKMPVTLDFSDLEYISSAGLRTILRLKKETGDVVIIHPSDLILDTLEMTGFTSTVDVVTDA